MLKLLSIFKKTKVESPEDELPSFPTALSYTGEITNHYNEIHIDKNAFPTITETKKPGHSDYTAVRNAYVDNAFYHVKSYYDYVISLDSLSSETEIHDHLKWGLKQFIAYVWDLPASQNHHHNFAFGNLVHSLEVACFEAEKAQREVKFFGKYGTDSHTTRMQKGYCVAAAFFLGLFHDCGKVHNYGLQRIEPKPVATFHPHEGGVLNFKLTFPGKYKTTWNPRAGNTMFWNVILFFSIVSPRLYKSFPQDIWEDLLTRLQGHNLIEGDRYSVAKNMGRDGHMLSVFCELFGEWYLQTSPVFSRPDSLICQISPTWLVIKPELIRIIAKRFDNIPEAEIITSLQAIAIVARGYNRNGSVTLELMYIPEGEKPIKAGKSDVFLFKAEPLIQTLNPLLAIGRHVEQFCKMQVHENSRKKIENAIHKPDIVFFFTKKEPSEKETAIKTEVKPEQKSLSDDKQTPEAEDLQGILTGIHKDKVEDILKNPEELQGMIAKQLEKALSENNIQKQRAFAYYCYRDDQPQLLVRHPQWLEDIAGKDSRFEQLLTELKDNEDSLLKECISKKILAPVNNMLISKSLSYMPIKGDLKRSKGVFVRIADDVLALASDKARQKLAEIDALYFKQEEN